MLLLVVQQVDPPQETQMLGLLLLCWRVAHCPSWWWGVALSAQLPVAAPAPAQQLASSPSTQPLPLPLLLSLARKGSSTNQATTVVRPAMLDVHTPAAGQCKPLVECHCR